MLITVFDFLLLGWIFWPIAIILAVWAHSIVADAYRFKFSASFLLAMITAAALYHYPDVRSALTNWHNIIYALTGYVIAGLIVAVVKWGILIVKFRTAAKEHLANGKSLSSVGWGYKFRTKQEGDVWMLDWSSYSIASWWAYWPLHTLYIVFEPLREFFNFLTKIFKDVFAAMSRAGGVKGD